MKHALGLLCLFSAIGTVAVAQKGNAESAQTFIISGQCTMLTMAGRDLTKNCNKKLISFSLQNGRVAFLFTINNLAIIQFSGNGRDQIATGKASAAQPVDRVTFTLLGITDPPRPTSSLAQGRCTYSNPFAGKPVMIDCRAVAKEGLFIGKFQTDGRTPSASNIPTP